MILIEKDKAVEEIKSWSGGYHYIEIPTESVERKMGQLPTIEIVRCRECKHHDGIRCFRWNSTIITGFDDFCSNGERRSENDITIS